MAGGIFSLNDELWFCSWVATNKIVWKFKKTGTVYDFADHNLPIHMIYRTAWMNQKLYSIDKHWIKVAVNSIRKGFSLLISQFYNYNETKHAEVSIQLNAKSTAMAKVEASFNNIKAQALSVGFENNVIHEDVTINGFDVQFSNDYDPGEVKR